MLIAAVIVAMISAGTSSIISTITPARAGGGITGIGRSASSMEERLVIHDFWE